MVPGNKYNFRKEEASYVTDFDGMRSMQFQMLTGDPVDNIQGVPRIGKVKAEKLLAAHPEIDDAWVAIAKAYKNAYGELHESVMVEMGRLLWMRRVENEMWSLPQILRKGEI
jgi:5'-3' exonuclease